MNDFSLANEFENFDETAWRGIVEKALKGADFEKALLSKTYDGLTIKPLYTKSDHQTGPLSSPVAAPPYLRGTTAKANEPAWDIRHKLCTALPDEANKEVLEALQGGANSISLRVAAPGQTGVAVTSATDLMTVLNEVELGFAPVTIDAGVNGVKTADLMQQVWSERNVEDAQALGAFNLDPLGTLARLGGLPSDFNTSFKELAAVTNLTLQKYPNVRSCLVSAIPYHDAGASEAQELACMAATFVAYLKAHDENGIEPVKAFPKMVFAFATDADMFLSIAKIRAARQMIWQICKSTNSDAAAQSLEITVQTSERMMARRDAHTNILRTTLATAAAAIAGANAITVLPFTWALGIPDRLAHRVARNTQLVLQEESNLGQVIDPSGGSWFIEKIGQELAQKAWTLFQEIESAGGMVSALQSGMVQDQIAKTAEQRASDIALSKYELTGVSAFPQLDGPALNVGTLPAVEELDNEAVTAEPLPLRRLAGPFEDLRDQSDAYKKATGNYPALFLATLGKLKDFNARANFASNFFASGGIETSAGKELTTPDQIASAFKDSGTAIACLASSDKIYGELAENAARTLKQAGAKHIVLAGRPGENRQALKEAGVDTFIHKGCDSLQVLRNVHELLDIGRIEA